MRRTTSSVLLAMLVAGCHAGPPAGQVVARVDGIEITDREVQQEAALVRVDLRHDLSRASTIQTLIDRKLFARAAEDALVTTTPAVQLALRRGREALLAEAYAQRIAAATPRVRDDEVTRLIRDEPHRFASRTGYLVDRIEVASPTLPPNLEALPLDAVATALSARGIAFRRQRLTVDSANLSAVEHASLAALGIGQRHATHLTDHSVVETIVVRWPISESLMAQQARARTMLENARTTAAIANALTDLRAKANIQRRPTP